MNKNNVLIISDCEKSIINITSRFSLLRVVDNISCCDYKGSFEMISEKIPALILLYSRSEDSLDILKDLRADNAIKHIPIILIYDEISEDKLCTAFDYGIDEFVELSPDTNAKFLITILNGLKKSKIQSELELKNTLLIDANIIDKETSIYSESISKSLFAKLFNNCKKSSIKALFTIISLRQESRDIVDIKQFANILRHTLRSDDIVSYANDSKLYLMLYDMNEYGFIKMLARVKNKLSSDIKFSTVCTPVNDRFNETISLLDNTLNDILIKNEEFKYIKMINDSDNIDLMNTLEQQDCNFKEFKHKFFISFEKIIAPVFYQVQTVSQSKLLNAQIKQSVDENETYFSIIDENISATLKITYPAFMRINIDFDYNNNGIIEQERTIYSLDNLSQKTIDTELKKLITKFSSLQKEKQNILDNIGC